MEEDILFSFQAPKKKITIKHILKRQITIKKSLHVIYSQNFKNEKTENFVLVDNSRKRLLEQLKKVTDSYHLWRLQIIKNCNAPLEFQKYLRIIFTQKLNQIEFNGKPLEFFFDIKKLVKCQHQYLIIKLQNLDDFISVFEKEVQGFFQKLKMKYEYKMALNCIYSKLM